jgi:putative SOS response-associated peptidase YedK
MCGRFTQLYSWAELHALYSLSDQPAPNLQPHYNIAPTDQAGVITPRKSGGRLHVRMRWGLIPNWWDKPLSELPSSFNARAETVASKPFFTEAFERRRCLVPASGFFEWTGAEGVRQPWYITSTDGRPLTFAGLYDRWSDPVTGDHAWSFTVIVGEPNKVARRYHDRMPVILGPSAWEQWLHEPRRDLLVPCPDEWLQAWPVTTRMNSSRYQESDSVHPIRLLTPSPGPALSP